MKKIGIFFILVSVVFQISGQEKSKEKQKETQVLVTSDKKDVKTLESLEKAGSSIDYEKDTLIKTQIEEKPAARINEKSDNQQNDKEIQNEREVVREKSYVRRGQRFRGHWAGLEFGFNNILTADNSFTLPSDIDYMNLHSGKSNNFNFNFSQLSFGVIRHIGFVTGLGINWNNYRFDGNFNIKKMSDGTIDSVWPLATLKKSKFSTVFLTLPVMLEIQLPVNNHHLNIAAGPIGAIKLGSHSRMVFEDGEDIKSFSDFSLNMLRYGATARVGYGNFQLYGTYYMTPLFRTGKGPGGNNLYPFEIGAAFTFND